MWFDAVGMDATEVWSCRTVDDPWTQPAGSTTTVDVCRADLDADAAGLEALLTADERARADRLRTPLLRARFVAARGYLRQMLGVLLNAPPHDVQIDLGPHGKPALAPRHPPLEFNLSHSGGVALYAFCRHAPVGIDIERVRDDLPWEQLAARYFAPNEAAAMHTPDAFFACWTRKEALVKASGTGLSQPLREVVAPPGWTVVDLHPEAAYRAALAVQGPADVQLWTWASVHSRR